MLAPLLQELATGLVSQTRPQRRLGLGWGSPANAAPVAQPVHLNTPTCALA